MSLNDYLKCPGLEHTLAVAPRIQTCSNCGGEVELWTDEQKRKCRACGFVVWNPLFMQFGQPSARGEEKGQKQEALDGFVSLALENGATRAVVLPASLVSCREELASLCTRPRCGNFGLSPSCPPHVAGPAALRGFLAKAGHAVFFRIDLPAENVYQEDRREIMRLVHLTAGEIRASALECGFARAWGFAGGSCKNIFCYEHRQCRVVSGSGPCRNQGAAMPSMSGFGVDVNRLVTAAGWGGSAGEEQGHPGKGSSRAAHGLVLLG